MSGLNLQNHFSLSSNQDVNAICQEPLNSIGVTYFNYIKIYEDGSRELLTNNAPWIDHFYINSLYKSVGVIDIEYLLPKGYFLWSELNTTDVVYEQGRESFNIDNGLSFVIKHENATVLYIFASTRENHLINSFYARNIDLFKRFILYFHDKGSNLLNNAAKNRIYLPEKQIIQDRELNKNFLSEQQRKEFFEKTSMDRFYIPNNLNLYLTKREAECAFHMLDGATAKEIAKILDLSFRTIETYIIKMREKFQCSSKDELIDLLIESNVKDVLFYKDDDKK